MQFASGWRLAMMADEPARRRLSWPLVSGSLENADPFRQSAPSAAGEGSTASGPLELLLASSQTTAGTVQDTCHLS